MEPKKNLKKCLEDLTKEELEELCEQYNIEYNKKSIDQLCEIIPNNFINFFKKEKSSAKPSGFEDIIEEGLELGFFFFDESEKIFLPEELSNILNEDIIISEEEKIETVKMYILTNLFACGILKKETIELIQETLEYQISSQELKKILDELNLKLYKNKYYINPEDVDFYDELIAIKEKTPSFNISNVQIMLYQETIYDLINDIKNKLKLSEEKTFDLLNMILYEPIRIDELDDVIKEFGLSKKKKKVEEILDNYFDKIRYWAFNGRTIDEYDYELVVEDLILTTKPKNNTLLSYLEACTDDILENIGETYGYISLENPKNLAKEITDAFNKTVYYNDKHYHKLLKNCNNKQFEYDILKEDLLSGFVFLYKDNDNIIKTIIPKEFQSILNKIKDEDLKEDIDDYCNQ